MSKEMLEQKTRKELRKIATEFEITGRWEMTKAQLIDAILRAESAKNSNVENDKSVGGVTKAKSANDECKIDNHNCENVEAEAKVENESANVKVNMDQKMSYIENINIGTIIAFRLPNGKVKSAKVTRKSTKNRKLKLETDYGAEYIISYDDVVWVRTGKRWPKGVYRLLKGLGADDVKEKQES